MFRKATARLKVLLNSIVIHHHRKTAMNGNVRIPVPQPQLQFHSTTSSTTTSETVTVTPQYGHLWGTSVVTEPGDHLYNVFVSSNSNANEGAIIFGTTPTADYTPGGYNSVTENVALYDPFVLAFRSGTDGIAPTKPGGRMVLAGLVAEGGGGNGADGAAVAGALGLRSECV